MDVDRLRLLEPGALTEEDWDVVDCGASSRLEADDVMVGESGRRSAPGGPYENESPRFAWPGDQRMGAENGM